MSKGYPRLEIFVLGGRLGESIVIRTPGGVTGVIDAYSTHPRDPQKNRTINKLNEMKVERLGFVSMTHPHMDHFSGLLSVLKKYDGKFDAWWRPPFGLRNWQVVIEQLVDEKKLAKNLNRQADYKTANRSITLLKEMVEVLEANLKLGIDFKKAEDEKVLYEEDEHDFSITSLGPSDSVAYWYEKDTAEKVIERGPQYSNQHHNMVSSVLAVKYGKWIGLLGGDTEEKSWEDVLKRCADKWVSKACFFKVSHHGSVTGSYERLWKSIKKKNCEAVLTCYAAQSLPTAKGVNSIHERKFTLHATSGELAAKIINCLEEEKQQAEEGDNNEVYDGEVHITVRKNGAMTIEHLKAAGFVTAP